MYDAIPLEMRMYPQWIVWRYEENASDKPTKVPYSPLTHELASVTSSRTWGTFDQAVHAATVNNWYSGIGFVLTDEDPYAFIDLDDCRYNKDGSPNLKFEADMERQLKIYNEFDSYAERSPSGNGLHIIVKATLPSGRRRSYIEVYSSQRYMTMTGDVYRKEDIKDYHEQLNGLWSQMGHGNVATAVYAGLTEAKDTDEAVIDKATKAQNGQKFLDLFEGRWQQYYPSQSEADFALVDIIAFYTQNRAQVARIFQLSELAKRDKAKRPDYINYMLNKCFDRILPPVDMDGLLNTLNEAIVKKEEAPQEKPKQPVVEEPKLSDIYSVPPGLVGEMAQFIYAQSPRPVAEVALVGALGFFAGIVGRAYNVSSTGLNQYVLLLAPTGTGKEAIASGVNKLMNAVMRTVGNASYFIGPSEISSSQALIKHMARDNRNTSFVSIVGEFGLMLQQMGSINAPPHLIGLRRSLLDIYGKSGEGQILRPSIYSDKEKNTNSVLAPALSILGESTPEKFYEGLHEGMIAEGLLPRFLTIEYYGYRPPMNKAHASAQPSWELVEKLSTICAHALMLNNQNKAMPIKILPEAEAYFDQLNEHCDLNINSSEREVRKQLWNRAHLKAMKLAGLVAVGCNPYDPTITVDIATWATNVVVADVLNLLKRFDSGEIGIDNDETKQIQKVIDVMREFILKPWEEIKKYAGENFSHLHNEKVIPYSYIQRKLAAVAIFKKDKRGSSESIKRAIKTLIERGDIQEISRPEMQKKYNTPAVAYMIANVKIFGL